MPIGQPVVDSTHLIGLSFQVILGCVKSIIKANQHIVVIIITSISWTPAGLPWVLHSGWLKG